MYTYPRNVCDEEILFFLDIVNLAIVNLDIVNLDTVNFFDIVNKTELSF